MELPTFTGLVAGADRLAPVLIDGAVRGVVILALAGVATLAMRRASAAARHWVWVLAFAGLLLLPVLAAVLPGWRVLPRIAGERETPRVTETVVITPPAEELALGNPMGAQNVPASSGDGTTGGVRHSPMAMAEGVPSAPLAEANAEPHATATAQATVLPPANSAVSAPAAARVSAAEETRPLNFASLSWTCWLAVIWLAGMLVILGQLLLGYASLWALKRRCVPLEGEWAALLAHLCITLGIRRRVELLSSPQRTMPMTWGLVKTRILLPEQAAEWPLEQRRAVLLHELGHARRWDCVTQLLAQMACAAYWFNPLAWVAWRRMQVERERACDDLVLTTGARASTYAQHLLHTASALSALRFVGAAVAMARPSTLEERLRAILDPQRSRRAVSARAAMMALLAFIAVLVPVAALQAQSAAALGAQADAPLTVKLIGTVKDDRRAVAMFQKADGTTSNLAIGESLVDKPGPVVVTGIEADRVVVTYAGATRELPFFQPATAAPRVTEATPPAPGETIESRMAARRAEQLRADELLHAAAVNGGAPMGNATCAFDATIYDVRIPLDAIDKLNVDALTKAAGDAAGFEKKLAELGTALPLYRASQTVRLAGDSVSIHTQTPYVTNSQMTNTGQRVNSVAYRQTGATFAIAGKTAGPRLQVSLKIDLGALSESNADISSDVNAPVFRNGTLTHQGPIEPNRPVVLIALDGGSVDRKGMAVAYIARVKFGPPEEDMPRPAGGAAVPGAQDTKVAGVDLVVGDGIRVNGEFVLSQMQTKAGAAFSRDAVDADVKYLVGAFLDKATVRADTVPVKGDGGTNGVNVRFIIVQLR